MDRKLVDENLESIETLVTPQEVRKALPVPEGSAQLVLETRQAIRDILHGRDLGRLLVVIGPCSIHDPAAALEYAGRLAPLRDALGDALCIVMRTYFEKPRTTVGWKGLINDPDLDGSCHLERGLRTARKVLLDINALGVPCASEMLDPITPQYLSGLTSWAAIGARTTESQTHREMASGLSMPVGFKNGTDGGLEVARNAIISSRSPHSFLGINADGKTSVIKTAGNQDVHLVLRGGRDGTNYSAAQIQTAAHAIADVGIRRAVMVDTSHDNSGKDHTRQASVCREVLASYRAGEASLMGLLIESNLSPGKQKWQPGKALAHGVSITDACIGWEETETLLGEMASAVRGRNNTTN